MGPGAPSLDVAGLDHSTDCSHVSAQHAGGFAGAHDGTAWLRPILNRHPH
ncbi:hypothetical protein I553_10685 [Mycobacterium xenopi 4042]|uniref:Uncharacterized protein n=1 Tax=Mycobacterium xenopi 4042 TaxID=1299334 RepID=X8DCD9_MYCXE|nr:hypothetical protein I553_10685 [Mycobacterium xenopi 4042]